MNILFALLFKKAFSNVLEGVTSKHYNLSIVHFFKHLDENSSYPQLSYLGTSICVLFYDIRWSMM